MGEKIIFPVTLAELREGIRGSELRRNILRICARYPRTIHQLIHAPEYPGIQMSVFSLQSEINVSVELGECKRLGLLVPVGKTPDPVVPGGRTELLRTSLLAFLVSPELCYLEQRAYRLYLEAWFQLGGWSKELLGLFLAFPELAHRGFYVESAVEQRFGDVVVRDIPLGPRPMGWWEVAMLLRWRPTAVGWESLRALPLPPLIKSLLLRRRPVAGSPCAVAPLEGSELFSGRAQPRPLSDFI